MNKLDVTYTDLLQDILDNGVTKKDRTGTGTLSVFGRQIRHKMSDGFPLLTTKKMYFKGVVSELLWFLRGDTSIKYLLENDCNIWNGDCYQAYVKKHKHAIRTEGDRSELAIQSLEKQLIYTQEEFINKIKTDDEFAKKWGDLGKIYGAQWRSWTNYDGGEIAEGTYEMTNEPIDQIANIISELKTNPDSRRLLVTAWNPADLDSCVLPPCHYGFQVYTRELNLDERAKLHPTPEMFYEINGTFSIGDSIENSNFPDKDWLHEQFDKGGIPKRAISLMWSQRSCDFFLGAPFNIASYGLLLEIIAKEVNMVPDELIGNLGDVHLYANHVQQAKEQIGRELTHKERIEKLFETNKDAKSLLSQEEPEVISSLLLDELKIPKRTREPFDLPRLMLPNIEGQGIFDYTPTDIEIWNYQSHPSIKAPLSN